MRKLYHYLAFGLTLFLSGCAIQGAGPQGGEKDIKPPEVKSEEPRSRTTNFKAEKITIGFNEFVDLSNAYSEVLISPTLPVMPKIYTSGKSVVLNMKGIALQPDRTYVIQFGKSIRDVHEGNILPDFKYVFSTGSYVDSMYIAGAIKDVQDRKLGENLRVFLYSNPTDSTPLKEKPLYFDKADKQGLFKIGNLPKQSFNLFIADDKNNNYIIDPNEDAGFIPYPLKLDSGLSLKVPVPIFPQQPAGFFIKKARLDKDRISLVFNKAFDSLSVNDKSIHFYYKKNILSDSVVLWPQFSRTFPNVFRISAHSGQRSIDTTISLSSVSFVKDKFFLDADITGESANLYGTPAVFKFNMPVVNIDRQKFIFMRDSVPLKDYQLRFADSAHLSVGIFYNFQEEHVYQVKIYPGAFTALNGAVNDSFLKALQLPERRNFGYLEVTVLPDRDVQDIFQLIKADRAIVYQKIIQSEQKIVVPYLQPGTYRMRLVRDANRNGRWDSGDIAKRKLPEEILYAPESLNIKANWELAGIKFIPKPQ